MKRDILPAPDYSGKNESAEAFMRDAAFEYEDWWEQQHPEEAAKQAEEFFNEFYDCFWIHIKTSVPFHWHIKMKVVLILSVLII